MRTILTLVTAALLAVFGIAGPAPAAIAGNGNPHFIYTDAAFDGTNLQVSFKEAGVGNGATVTVSTSATFSYVLGCVNGGSNHPKAANKSAFSSTASASGEFTATSGGNIVADLTLAAPTMQEILGRLSCPNGQTTTLFSAGWSNLSIADSTNGITVAIPGTWSVV